MAPSGRFTSKPHLVHVHGRVHQVTRQGVYVAADGAHYVIPRGFETDGASVPRPLWWLYPPFGQDYEPAAILHDYLYAHAEQYPGSDQGHLSRGEADALFLEAMAALGYRASGRRVIHAAVRAGGWKAWNRYRADAREGAGV